MKHLAAPDEIAPDRPKRILLAEDDTSLRSFLAEVLRADGHEVVDVGDGQVLIERVASAITAGSALADIDLIVSDIRMPRFNALQIVAAMRNAGIVVPTLLMTAFGDEPTHHKARMLGVLDILDKPFKIDELRTAVCDALFGHIVAVAAPSGA